MKKIAFILILILTFGFATNIVFANNEYMINLFYAIESGKEYSKTKEVIVGNSNHMYFQWARLTPNDEGNIEFTNKYKTKISEYDNRNLEYGVPNNSISGYMNKIDFNNNFPKGQAYLSIFFENYIYNYDKSAGIEFLNMTETQWNNLIIDPMISMVNGLYNETSNNELEFEGVVLDFEGFRDTFDNDNYPIEKRSGLDKKYNKFIRQLKESLGDKKLIVCVHPSNVEGYFNGYDYEYISNIADYIILMAYNYYDANKLQNNTEDINNIIKSTKENIYETVNRTETQPYDKVRQSVKDLINQYNVNKDKLILGLDIAGMKWIKLNKKIEDQNYQYYIMRRPDLDGIEEAIEGEEIYISQSRTSKKILTGENILKKDKEEFEKNGVVIEKVEYYYETPKSLEEKYYSILKEFDIAGLSMWRLGTSSKNAIKELYQIHYDNQVDIWEYRQGITTDKIWNIKFTLPIDENTVNNDHIYITDKYDEKVDILIELNVEEDRKTVKVTPIKEYQKSHTYNFYINKGIKSTSGKGLNKGIRIRFTTID